MICARCWTLTKDFHQFYLTIQEAQSDFIATANYDDAEEHANGSAIANCNNGNTTTMAATLKAKFMQNDAVSLNCLNAGILEPDKSLGGLGANYELPICELPTDDDLVRNIMHDDVLHIEMQLEDNAVKSGTYHIRYTILYINIFLCLHHSWLALVIMFLVIPFYQFFRRTI